MPPSNQAAFLTGPKARPLKVSSATYPTAGPGELLVRNRAVSANYIEGAKQQTGDMMFNFLKYPLILGTDIAGEVITVGAGVTRFKPGDRVTGMALGMDARGRRPDEGAYQEIVAVREQLVSRLPERVSFAEGVVLPLAVGTAACGLFEKGQLALDAPEIGKKRNGKTLLVWGASTSVGLCATQLAVAAGYDVIATASPKNWELVRSLGAGEVFDYNSDGVVEDLVRALKKTNCAGAIAIGDYSLGKCVDIISRVDGVKFVSQASFDVPSGGIPAGGLAMIPFVAAFTWNKIAMWWKLRRSGIGSKFIFGSDLVEWDQKDQMVFGFLEKALEAGTFKPSPEPLVVGNGLDKIQEGLDLMMKGVSAKKVVITLEK